MAQLPCKGDCASPESATAMMLGLAANEISEDDLARWIADKAVPAPGRRR
jgi:hypothetical protein